MTARINVKSDDEIGELVGGINVFIEKLHLIMKDIKASYDSIKESSVSMDNEISEVNNNANNISASMQQMAAGMQEVSATVEEISAGTDNIFKAMVNITDKIEQGNEITSKIQEKSVEYRTTTENGMNTTNDMVVKIKDGLNQSIENSRKVERIQELTEDILSISSQTNICGKGSCFLNGLFRLHILILSCVLYKSQPSSQKDSPLEISQVTDNGNGVSMFNGS